MNFFEHQDLARKKTTRLVVLFIAAVAFIVVAIYAVSLVSLGYAMSASADGPRAAVGLWNPIAALIAVGVSAVLIGGGSLYKINQLRMGGIVIAEELGGSLLTHNNADTDGLRLLNIVEEMAIASGVPVPPVFLLRQEEGINAFAAGYSPEDAVIGVTNGALHGLSRDQLQGVIAHEFSHILSGDMRINLRLVAVLHGILILGLTGAAIMRGLFYSGAGYRSRSSRDNDNGGGVVIAIFAIAAALAAIGYIGTFFGNLIKSAVSRQREYLADASAVQFTRNPEGIADALKVLGGASRKGRLRSPNAPEASHMFFGDALTRAMGSAMSTHPPLDTRIRRIEPGWDGKFLSPRATAASVRRGDRDTTPRPVDRTGRRGVAGMAGVAGLSGMSGVQGTAGVDPAVGFAVSHRQAVARAGGLDAQSVAHAQSLIARIPGHLRDAAHDPFEARAVILSMLIQAERTEEGRQKQAEALRTHEPKLFATVARLAPAVVALPDDLRLPLLEQAMQPIASLSGPQLAVFRTLVDAFIGADDSVNLFEWILRRLLTRRLDAASGRLEHPRVRYYALGQLGGECSVLLSAIAYAGGRADGRAGRPDDGEIREAFSAGAAALPGLDLQLLDRGSLRLESLGKALDTLDTIAPKLKKQLLEACAAAIMQDGTVTPTEAELFRAVGESLRVPMPVMFATAG